MANLYTAHKDEWKALADIDYFGMFVRAYIPFNAWMNVSYPTLNTDRAKINEIKHNLNPFRNKICSLLDSNSQEGTHFRGLIGELHDLLESYYIHNQDKRITFTNITLGRNPKNIEEITHNGIGFRVQYGNGTSGNTQITTLIKRRNGSLICNITQTDYNFDEIKTHPTLITNVKEDYVFRILNCYQAVIPYIIVNLTAGFDITDESKSYGCGNYKFIKDSECISNALIEVVYMLRNSLFHGELVPDKEANKVYGAAYHILRILIEAI